MYSHPVQVTFLPLQQQMHGTLLRLVICIPKSKQVVFQGNKHVKI